MSDQTAIAQARWRKRNATQAVKDALVELRVANQQLAALEGRPVGPLFTRTCNSAGARRGGFDSLPSAVLTAGAPDAPAVPCLSDAVSSAGSPTPVDAAEGPAADEINRSSVQTAAGPEQCNRCGHPASERAHELPFCFSCWSVVAFSASAVDERIGLLDPDCPA